MKNRAWGSMRLWSVALCLLLVTVQLGTACPFERPTETVSVNGHVLFVELAVTPEERACGLAHRMMLPADNGMLFIYERITHLQFWMKDTTIPLSIAFLDASGTIINIARMQPDQTLLRYRSQRPAMYALEVNQGWFAERSIVPGDRVIFSRSIRP